MKTIDGSGGGTETAYYARLHRRLAIGTADQTGWAKRHQMAVLAPTDGFELSLVGLFGGWLRYADAHHRAYGSGIGEDGVLGESWAQIGAGLRGLLNGELHRLDGGTLDRILHQTLSDAGFDPERL